MKSDSDTLRIGIDLGGTKISAVCMDGKGSILRYERDSTPQNDYLATIKAIVQLVGRVTPPTTLEQPTIGVGIPGSECLETGRIQNANSTWLNGRPLRKDLERALGQEVLLENDANCFVLSEAWDGAAAPVKTVFGVILGTGCGGGLIVNGGLHKGHRNIGGEWGHTPLPAPTEFELTAPQTCWCGRTNCLETWISGPALLCLAKQTHAEQDPDIANATTVEDLIKLEVEGNSRATQAFADHTDRLARGLASIINILDPDLIVLGGGLSNLQHLYTDLPPKIAPLIFANDQHIQIHRPKHGDDSGVRGAARLWDMKTIKT